MSKRGIKLSMAVMASIILCAACSDSTQPDRRPSAKLKLEVATVTGDDGPVVEVTAEFANTGEADFEVWSDPNHQGFSVVANDEEGTQIFLRDPTYVLPVVAQFETFPAGRVARRTVRLDDHYVFAGWSEPAVLEPVPSGSYTVYTSERIRMSGAEKTYDLKDSITVIVE